MRFNKSNKLQSHWRVYQSMPNERNGYAYDSRNTYYVAALIIEGSIYWFVTSRLSDKRVMLF
jgi:hypothetical protein